MLDRLRLRNFRGFDDHVIPIRDITIVVGANNAGKSTVVEALRLIALVTNRFRRGTSAFADIPEWLDHPDAFRGIQPAVGGRLGFEGHGPSTFHQYGEPPAVLTAYFDNAASVSVFVGPDGEVHGVARDAEGHAVGTAAAARALNLTPIQIQPQVAPLLREERLLVEATVRRGEGTYLAPQHFCNQLLLFDNDWGRFVELAEATWPGLQVTDLRAEPLHPEEPLHLDVRDGPFVGEVSLMGHGLQMWLQTVWFLARADPTSTVVLDEPDVYMHPDLQRRLLNLVRRRFGQLIIATHSIEIISDVDPSSILSIDRSVDASKFLTDLPGVQAVIDALGGVHSIQVSRLLRGRAFILVEGDDLRIMRALQSQIAPDAEPLDLISHGQLGGRGGWSSGLPTRLPTRNTEGRRIAVYCVLDRDYFPDDEVQERYAEARDWNVNLRIWTKKEVENFLLVPALVARFISAHARAAVVPPTVDEVTDEIDRVVEGMRSSPITDGIANELFNRNRRAGITSANRAARLIVDEKWRTQSGRWSVAPGKAVISALSAWSQPRFGVSFGAEQLARLATRGDLDPELVETIDAIAARRRLTPPPP